MVLFHELTGVYSSELRGIRKLPNKRGAPADVTPLCYKTSSFPTKSETACLTDYYDSCVFSNQV